MAVSSIRNISKDDRALINVSR